MTVDRQIADVGDPNCGGTARRYLVDPPPVDVALDLLEEPRIGALALLRAPRTSNESPGAMPRVCSYRPPPTPRCPFPFAAAIACATTRRVTASPRTDNFDARESQGIGPDANLFGSDLAAHAMSRLGGRNGTRSALCTDVSSGNRSRPARRSQGVLAIDSFDPARSDHIWIPYLAFRLDDGDALAAGAASLVPPAGSARSTHD